MAPHFNGRSLPALGGCCRSGHRTTAKATIRFNGTGKDIVVHGSATLVQTLMEHNLVDRYRLLVYPLVLGKGKRLFREGIPATLKLLESRAFSSGVVAVVYEPDRQ